MAANLPDSDENKKQAEPGWLLPAKIAVVVMGVIRFQYQVVRIALQTTIAMSIAVVAFDLTLSLFLAELMSRLAGF